MFFFENLTGYKLNIRTISSNHCVKYETRSGKYILPHHIGTGVNFITEILIVCFATPNGGMVIMENPKKYLYPELQVDLIDFIAKIAKTGNIQFVIESHSDHLFNGIRRLIGKRKLELSKTAVFYFLQDLSGLSHAELIEFSPQGGVNFYIPGMFE